MHLHLHPDPNHNPNPNPNPNLVRRLAFLAPPDVDDRCAYPRTLLPLGPNKGPFVTLGFRKYLRKYAYRSQKVPLARREISGGGARLVQIHTSRNSIRKMGVLDTLSF